MELNTISLNNYFLLYIGIIALVALVFFLIEVKSLFKIDLNAPKWVGVWSNFGIFIWGLLVIFICGQQAVSWVAQRFFLEWNDFWVDILAGMVLQMSMLSFILIAFWKFSKIYNRGVNHSTSLKKNAFTQGVIAYFSSLPILWLSGFIWSYVLVLLKNWGIAIDLQPQVVVTIFTKSHSSGLIITIILLATLLAPIVEELIFRGGLYRFIKTQISVKVGLLISALAFGLAHANLASFLPLFIMGLLLARAYEKTGHILTPITFHALFNLNTLIILLLQPELSSL